MLQTNPNNNILDMKDYSENEIITFIINYIQNNYSENLIIDITHLNIINSLSVITNGATAHFLKYPKGKIEWLISSPLIECLNSNFELGNNIYNAILS